MTKADLIARLEKEGGSRELDAEIHLALDETGNMEWYVARDGEEMIVSGDDIHGRKPVNFPKYTTSLDASIALCEQKTETREQFIEVLDKGVDLWIASGDEDYRTMPKYVVIALLRALEDGK